jgi:hypothetical protein
VLPSAVALALQGGDNDVQRVEHEHCGLEMLQHHDMPSSGESLAYPAAPHALVVVAKLTSNNYDRIVFQKVHDLPAL